MQGEAGGAPPGPPSNAEIVIPCLWKKRKREMGKNKRTILVLY